MQGTLKLLLLRMLGVVVVNVVLVDALYYFTLYGFFDAWKGLYFDMFLYDMFINLLVSNICMG